MTHSIQARMIPTYVGPRKGVRIEFLDMMPQIILIPFSLRISLSSNRSAMSGAIIFTRFVSAVW
jgi:hypothetical protein